MSKSDDCVCVLDGDWDGVADGDCREGPAHRGSQPGEGSQCMIVVDCGRLVCEGSPFW